MNRVELPINVEPKIRTFSYYGFTHAIIDNEFTNGDVAAKLFVRDYEKYEWKSRKHNLEIKRDADSFSFYANEFRTYMNACIFRKAMAYDDIEIRIDYQQFSQPWGAVNIFLSDLSEENMMEDDSYLCRMGYFNKKGVYLRTDNDEKVLKKSIKSIPVRLKIRREESKVYFYSGEELTDVLYEYELPSELSAKEIYIGFQVKLNNNTYFDWLFSNYIQLSCDIDDADCKLKYYYGLYKDYRYYMDNYFLNYNKVNVREYKCLGISIFDFVKGCLSNRKYVEAFFDQYYIKGQAEYGKQHCYHQFMIYGFDDLEEKFEILGYNFNGILEKEFISYEDFNKCLEEDFQENLLVVTEFEPDSRTFELNVNNLMESIKDYIDGKNTSVGSSNYFAEETRQFGMNIYAELMSDKGLWLLTRDRRISFLLLEHKKCMADRVRYLAHMGYISSQDKEVLEKMAAELIDKAAIIRNYSIKGLVIVMKRKDKQFLEKIRDLLEELKKSDLAFMNGLLNALASKNK